MYGNVSEMCWDWYWDYPREPQSDPAGPASLPFGESAVRVIRGGARTLRGYALRSACRNNGGGLHYIGFRLVRNAE